MIHQSLRRIRLGSRQRGFTLVEILVALLIGLFLLAGLFVILQNTRRTSSNQTGLSQLQDEQRMAMSILNDIGQSAGYFDATTYQSAKVLWNAAVSVTTAGGSTLSLAPGQAVTGAHTAASPGDTLVVRYYTNGSASATYDNMVSCTGVGGTGGAATTYVNMFWVDSATSQLYCSPNGNTASKVALVAGVANMQVYYGVATAPNTNNVDTYMTADLISAANWLNVTSMRITLTFNNPLYTAATAAQTPQFVNFTRVIPLQNRTGVIASAL
jgi:type IV pilus assembly protein PilW